MAAINTAKLAHNIQQLVKERQKYADSLERIDGILSGLRTALDGASVAVAVIAPKSKESAPTAPVVKGKKKRRGRNAFAVSAEQSILAFVTEKKNPTTPQINEHFKKEGRSSTADNALGKLVKEKKLKRTKLERGRGSEYSLA